MIVKMQKYSFLVFHTDYEAFLEEIRRLGVVHIETKAAEPAEDMQEMMRALADVTQTLKTLEARRNAISEVPALSLSGSGEDLLGKLKDAEAELERLEQYKAGLEKEITQLEPWGDFSQTTVQKLAESGVKLRFLLCSLKNFRNEWIQEYPVGIVSDHQGYRHFILASYKNGPAAVELPGVDEIAVPERSISELKDLVYEAALKITELQRLIDTIAYYGIQDIENYRRELKTSFDFAFVKNQTSDEAEGKVKLVEGWVPKPNCDELNRYLETQTVAWISRDPIPGEKVPVLLKNNKFTRVFEIIGDFYDMPNYRELDLTPFFAPFYMLYFGIALGDAGYGLIVLLAATLAKRKLKKMKQVLTLGQFLGLGTVIFGLCTGTFFGLSLGDFNVPLFQSFKDKFITTDQLFTLSLILGAIQIMFGMFIKVANITISQGFRYAFSTIGWIIMILGMGSTYMLSSKGVISEPLAGNLYKGVGVVAGLLIFVLNDPKRNIFMNILAGIWDTYGMVTGVLGDMLSYVRLFALGISGGILASVFNMMGTTMKPDIPVVGFIIMAIILLAGHGITLVMSGIGAFVHPIRLTFVEFYKNAGFMGGGKKYSPFATEPEQIENNAVEK
jgi:V/A-type H+-transporting ATPase subunit I